MNRTVLGAFAIAGGLALWATIGASAQGSTAPPTFDPSTCPAQDQLQLQQSLTGINSADATAQLQELNADATMAKAEIVADTNEALAELTAENADEGSDEEDGTTGLTLDARILAIKTEACQALGNLVKDYNSAIAELTAEFSEPQQGKDVDQEKPEKQDVERDTEREQPESSTEREGHDD